MALITTDGTAAFLFFMKRDKLPPLPPAPPQHKGRVWQQATVILIAVVLLLVACFPAFVATWVKELSPGCWFREWTGIACPGCGGTRAVCCLLEGDAGAACRYQPLLPAVALVLLVEYLRWGYKAFCGGRDWQGCRWHRRLLCGFVVVTLLWFVLRNIWGI